MRFSLYPSERSNLIEFFFSKHTALKLNLSLFFSSTQHPIKLSHLGAFDANKVRSVSGEFILKRKSERERTPNT